MKFYTHPRCTTCKKAELFLKNHEMIPTTIDITQTPPSLDELEKALKASGSIRKLFNTSGMRYRELDLKNRLDHLSDSEALKLLADDGMLVKRPFLITKNGVLSGFREKDWKKLFSL